MHIAHRQDTAIKRPTKKDLFAEECADVLAHLKRNDQKRADRLWAKLQENQNK